MTYDKTTFEETASEAVLASDSASIRSLTTPQALQHLLCEELRRLDYPRRQVSFLLGTDEQIHQERRVALTPRHVSRLRHDLMACGLEPRLYVISGAGERAVDDAGTAFGDAAYRAAGARIVTASEAPHLPALDVVHALKEPTAYESELPGPVIRIGALHLASRPPGLCQLLARQSFAAVLDGATVGNCSYLKYGGDRTPIVASMSRFAGAVAGRKVVEGVLARGIGPGRVIVVGGGIAGLSAIRKLGEVTRELVVVEPFAPTRQRLAAVLPALGFGDRFRIAPRLDPELFDGAVGIVFAHRSGAKAAEKVCSYDDLRRMRPGAAIADIAIDQGGSIHHPGYCEDDDAAASRDKYRRLLRDYSYYAETNMPREEPYEASEVHGDASLPYVTALLALCALHGGPEAAIDGVLAKGIRVFEEAGDVADVELLDCVVQDLRNGTQLVASGGELRITDSDIERDTALAEWVRGCWNSR